MGKKVPLVIYDGNGKRRIIGEAVVDIDGGVEMTVTDDTFMETLSRVTENSTGEFSIGFHPHMPKEITHPPYLPSFEEGLYRGGGSVMHGALPLEFLESLADKRDNLDKEE